MRRAVAALVLAPMLCMALAGCARTARDAAALDADADARARTAAKTLVDLDAAAKASASPPAPPQTAPDRPRPERPGAEAGEVAGPAAAEAANLQD